MNKVEFVGENWKKNFFRSGDCEVVKYVNNNENLMINKMVIKMNQNLQCSFSNANSYIKIEI